MDNKLRAALRKVLDYNWVDEREDYRDHEEDGDVHIFVHLVALDNFLQGTTKTPSQHVAERS